MKIVTSGFKDALIESGREFDSKIIFTISGTTTTLGPEELTNTNLSYKGSILKSIMKQLEFETETNIPLETILEYRIGLKVNDVYEYISYGNFVVKNANFNDDRNSYTYTCYDKMVYSMEDYESLGVTYPITIRNYINAICTKIGLTFKNANSTFTNYDKQIPSELYLDSQGRSLFYSYRDVLDELAQVTASCICINEADDELEIRYVNNTNETLNSDYLKDTNIKRNLEIYGPINQVTLSRGGDSDKLSKNDAESITQNGLTEIKIKDNQILNGEDRQQYLNEIFTRINGLSYTLCDLSSYGILYFELLDKFSFAWTDDESNTHTINCLMLNNEIEQKNMVEEKIECNKPLTADDGYAEVSQEVKNDNRAKIDVDKVNARVEAIVENVGEDGEVTGASLLLAINNDSSQATLSADKISLEGYTTINDGFQIDENGNAIINGANLDLIDNGGNEQGINSRIKITKNDGSASNTIYSNYNQMANSEPDEEDEDITYKNILTSTPTSIRLQRKKIEIIDGVIHTSIVKAVSIVNDNNSIFMSLRDYEMPDHSLVLSMEEIVLALGGLSSITITPHGIKHQEGMSEDAYAEFSTILYENTNGSTSEITLNDKTYNYSHIEIIFAYNTGAFGYCSSKIFNPDGKIANLTAHALSNNYLYIGSSQWTISGNKITPNINEYWRLNANAATTRGTTATIRIFQVIGYK